MRAAETVGGFFAFCHCANEMEIGSAVWDGFVYLCWVVGQHYASEPIVCIKDCLSALQVREACCSQTDLHALVLMLSWAEENVCSVSDSNSFCGWLGNLRVLTVPCTFYLCLIPLSSYCVSASPFKNA